MGGLLSKKKNILALERSVAEHQAKLNQLVSQRTQLGAILKKREDEKRELHQEIATLLLSNLRARLKDPQVQKGLFLEALERLRKIPRGALRP